MHLYITFHSLMNVALKDKWDVWLENYLLLFGHYLIAIKFYTMLSIFSISYRITNLFDRLHTMFWCFDCFFSRSVTFHMTLENFTGISFG